MELKLIAVGDNLIHKEIFKSVRDSEGDYDFNPLYDPVRDAIQAADIRIVNQETVFTDKASEYSSFPIFATPVFVADSLVKAGFNVVTHASNHAFDKKRRGLEVTWDYWKTHYPEVGVVGISGSREESNKVYIIERNGFKVAILNYTEKLNGHFVPPKDRFRIARLRKSEKRRIQERIAEARALADIVVVCPHWGCEYLYEPIRSQREWAAFFAQCGVDLVIGTHPHVVQPMETVTRADGKPMLVYYSLGNFISCQVKAGTALGGFAHVVFEKDEQGVRLKEYGLEPLITHADEGFRNFRTYFLRDYTEALAGENQIFKTVSRLRGIEMSKASQERLFEDIISYKAQAYNEYKTPRDVTMANIKSVFNFLIGKNIKK